MKVCEELNFVDNQLEPFSVCSFMSSVCVIGGFLEWVIIQRIVTSMIKWAKIGDK